jgi:hypothetical protein
VMSVAVSQPMMSPEPVNGALATVHRVLEQA